MPSQEDYLDNLLKDLSEEDEAAEASGQDMPEQDVSAPDLDAAAEMSEDEIERLLSAGQADDELQKASDAELPDEDVLKMLEGSEDEELQGIQELLQKSDNNEAVDDSIAELLQDYPEEDLNAKVLGDAGDKPDKEEKKRLAKEKKEQAKAQREQRRAEAAAKKAEKKAAKAAAKAEKQKNGKKSAKNTQAVPADGAPADVDGQDMFDPAVLDSIVSEADRAGQALAEKSEDLVPNADESVTEESKPADGGSDELDLDSLFGGDESAPMTEDGGDEGFEMMTEAGMDAALARVDAEDSGEPKQKQGLFAKLINFLTEEDEEENEDIKLTKENQDILDDLDKEGKGGKGKKGKKKKKDKDDKDGKDKAKKAAKPKKAPKPKKEKKPKEAPTVPEKKLSFKKMLPVILVGASVGVLLFVFVNAVTDYTAKRTARAAYYEGDYQTCYQNLIGKDLDETESIMFGKSESILYIRLWVREYEMFMGDGDRVRALDSLIQTVDMYPELYHYAGQWNAESEVAAGYAVILNYLVDDFGLTESVAQEIAAVRSDWEYTKIVTALANGMSYESWNAPGNEVTPDDVQTPSEPSEDVLPDALPEEGELGNDTFIDNQ